MAFDSILRAYDMIIGIRRICPMCSREMKYRDFLSANLYLINSNKRIKIWINEKISILCCHCWFLIDVIRKNKNCEVIITDEVKKGFVIRDIMGYTQVKINSEMYYNMEELGLIDENE